MRNRCESGEDRSTVWNPYESFICYNLQLSHTHTEITVRFLLYSPPKLDADGFAEKPAGDKVKLWTDIES